MYRVHWTKFKQNNVITYSIYLLLTRMPLRHSGGIDIQLHFTDIHVHLHVHVSGCTWHCTCTCKIATCIIVLHTMYMYIYMTIHSLNSKQRAALTRCRPCGRSPRRWWPRDSSSRACREWCAPASPSACCRPRPRSSPGASTRRSRPASPGRCGLARCSLLKHAYRYVAMCEHNSLTSRHVQST